MSIGDRDEGCADDADGVHDEGGEVLDISIPISIIGESREHCIVMVVRRYMYV